MVCPYQFYGICNQHKLIKGCAMVRYLKFDFG